MLQRNRFNDWFRQKGKVKNGRNFPGVGCSYEELVERIEAKFRPGMTWENYGTGEDKWNIDHIIPLSLFDPENEQHRILAFHYANLQPLWHLENIKKGCKYDKHTTELSE